jgi:deoxyribodipyrimidine photo-lyase
MSTAIVWIRRDLRLADNTALYTALAHADSAIPVYVLDPVLIGRYAGTKRLAFLYGALHHLDADLRERGSQLAVRRGDSSEVLRQLLLETSASAIYAEEDWTPYARKRDDNVTQNLPLHLVGSPIVRPPGTVLKQDGQPYSVFTPFRKKWQAFPPPAASELLPPPSEIPTPRTQSLPIPDNPSMDDEMLFPPTEQTALARLQAFTQGSHAPIYSYAQDRDRMDLEGTSRLSPYLRFGLLSARQAFVAAYEALVHAPDDEGAQGAQTWINELIWREFYVSILYHFPQVLQYSFRPALQDIVWDNDKSSYDAWCTGQTGYPVVDAGMRQLFETGWMHNRARMIVASFLVKDLLIDWRWGEAHFMQHLLDADPAANNGGWQWTAGTGTDAAPYFRVFNPVLQGKRYDPRGAYVRHWVPELRLVPDRYIHTPWKMSAQDQLQYGCLIGRDYPAPIVDHKIARERALDAYRAARMA